MSSNSLLKLGVILSNTRHTCILPYKFKRHMSSNNAVVNVEFCNGVKKITMCDIKTRNSLSIKMMEQLLEHIRTDSENKELRVIVLAAQGPIFSAGHNLKELEAESGKSSAHQEVFNLCSDLMTSIIECPVPVLAQIDGLAAAAGCQLVAQCDMAVCTENSSFSTPGANFGIFCSTPGIPLARKVLKATALKMVLTGRPISAAEAKSSGLVTTVCSKENLEKEVESTCESIIEKSRSVIELGKKFFYKQVELELKKAYQLGAEKMVENLELPDGKEGMKSFVEKRKPKWTHQ